MCKDKAGELLTLSPICTHLSCTVPLASEEDRAANPDLVFKCPCHDGLYDREGVNIGGPPPRPLDAFEPYVEDGIVYIRILSPQQRS
ncbi:Rieske (2Fe-2S) iron-sulfur domain containing protein [Caldalkalibacillus thermarum TA2.A1]|uniref:Rieske (2Fe-2S) iron-sulfur domain containing protein n=1 Tax=Caldalkalibacillus thermarum (strain TA2.A1) TaxID=986075 RepID=F5L2Y0_CALTT|nr:Rieske (2Fe-2S) iron-sulfur domain containing protein [Caldalkalibacillus thermarum TA2.A1]QZT35139.1 Rieske 2Fe-2S domain-containing protein [Caldalkalibacillus thermarum TA2.A1]